MFAFLWALESHATSEVASENSNREKAAAVLAAAGKLDATWCSQGILSLFGLQSEGTFSSRISLTKKVNSDGRQVSSKTSSDFHKLRHLDNMANVGRVRGVLQQVKAAAFA